MPAYAVTGAGGRLGRQVVEHLLKSDIPADEVVAAVRTPATAADLAQRGVVVREADYSRPDTLGPRWTGSARCCWCPAPRWGSAYGSTPR